MPSFPKWLHKDWKPSTKGDGHHEAKESKLVQTEVEAKALLSKGWTEEAPKATAKKEEPKEK